MTSEIETELKLSAAPDAIARLVADASLFGEGATTREQLSTYFDTPDRALHNAGLSLRIRRIGDRRVQTVKAESAAAASLFAREEWEKDVAGDVPELDDITIAMASAPGMPPPEDIAPVFVTEVTRTAIVRGEGGRRIELVADLGRIIAGDRETPIAEFELELVEGEPAALFDLASRLAERVPLRLGVRSKSERGYALLQGSDSKAVKSEPIRLNEDMDAATLFATIAAACLRHFRLNEDRLLATGKAETLHQARVALRRLRSLLTIFRAMLAGPDYERFRTDLRWISGLLGEVRNIDVLIPRIEDEDALGRLRNAHASHMATLAEALDSSRTRTLMLDLAEWIAVGAWREDAALADARAIPAQIFAHDRLDRLRRRFRKSGRKLAELDEEARHEVRILAKKLRYAAEFFAGLFPGGKAARRRGRLLAQVEAVQSALGELNDVVSGRMLLAGLGVADVESLLRGGGRKSTRKLLRDAEDAYDAVVDEKRFWR